jgi:hypothetical protein
MYRATVWSPHGDTLDYTDEVKDGAFTIWFGERGSPAYYRGEFSRTARSAEVAGSTPAVGGTSPT